MRFLALALLIFAPAAFALPPTAQPFVFHLAGDQEVPPTPSTARGGCFGAFDAGTSELQLTCVHNVLNATSMAIRRGPAGTNGLVAFDLGAPSSPKTATWSGMTPADVADLLAGNLYIEIRSSDHPFGEIRGQILPRTVDVVNFSLNGSRVVPPNSTPATGNCTADLSNNAMTLAIACTHNVPAAVDAHVHEAPPAQNGPIAFTFPSPASPLNDNMPMTPLLLAEFAGGFLYLDVHGAPDEIRGQISSLPDPPRADLAVAKSGPANVVSAGAITYLISISNSGPDAATAVVVTDTLPAGTTLQSAVPTQGACSGTTTITCNIGTINSGASTTVTLTVTAPAGPASVTNTASVSSPDSDPSTLNNSSSTTAAVAAPVVPIPTLTGWMLIALAIGLAGIALTR